MDCKKIFNLLDNERKFNFKNRSELSDKLEFPSKQGFHIFMKRLKIINLIINLIEFVKFLMY